MQEPKYLYRAWWQKPDGQLIRASWNRSSRDTIRLAKAALEDGAETSGVEITQEKKKGWKYV